MKEEKQTFTWNVNLSSVIIGFLLALCLTLALGASGSGSEGPYRISAASEMGAYVIDTETGHTWMVSRTDQIDLGTPFDRVSRRRSIIPMVE